MNRTVDKFCIICYTLCKNGDKWEYWKELLENYENDVDYDILKNKMDKVLELLKIKESEIIYLDVEKELWELV